MKIISNPLKSFVWLISLTLGWGCIRQSVYSASSFRAHGVDGYQVEDAELEGLNENLRNLMETITGELQKKNDKSESNKDWDKSLSTFFEDIKNINNMFNTQQNKTFLVSLINLIKKIKNHPSGGYFNSFFDFTGGLHVVLKQLQSKKSKKKFFIENLINRTLQTTKNNFFEMSINIMEQISSNQEKIYDNIYNLKQLLWISYNGFLDTDSPINVPKQKEELIQLFIELMEAIANKKHKNNFTNNMSEFEFFLRYFTQALKHLRDQHQKEQFINVVIVLMNKVKDLEPEDLNKNLGYVGYLSLFVDRLLGHVGNLEKQKKPEIVEDFIESMEYIGQLTDDAFKQGLQKFHYFISLFFNLSTKEIKLSEDKTIKPKFVDPLIKFLKLQNQLNPDLLKNDTQGLNIFNAIMIIFNIRLNFDIPTGLYMDSFASHKYRFLELQLLLHYFFECLDKISEDDQKREFIDSVVGLIEDSFEFLDGIKEGENHGQLTDSFNPKTLDKVKQKLNLVCNYMIDFYEKNIKTAVNGDMSDTQESKTIQLKEALAIILEEKVKTDRILEIKKKERQEIALEEEKKKKERQIWEAQQKEHKRKIEEQNKLEGEAFNLKSKEESERLKEQLELDNNKRTVVSTENLEQQQLQPDQNLFSSSSSFSIPIATTLVVTGTVIVLAKSMASKPPQQSQPNPSQQNYPQTSMVQENYQFEYHNSVEAY